MKNSETRFEMEVWVVAWPQGTTLEYRDEPQPAPQSLEPICAEPHLDFMYFDKTEKREVHGDVMTTFRSKEEAEAYLESDGSAASFQVFPARIIVYAK